MRARRRRLALLAAIAVFVVGCSLVRSFDGFDEGHPSAEAGADARDGDGSSPPGDAAASDAPADGEDAGGYRAVVLSDHPVGYFPLDEAAGTTLVADVTGGPPATALNQVTLGEPGIHGGSAHFTGSIDDYIAVGDRFDFPNGQPFSFEFWAKPTILEQAYYNPLTKRAFPAGYSMYFTHSGDGTFASFTWDMGNADASAMLYAPFPRTTKIPLPDGSTQFFDAGFVGDWVHVVGVFDGKAMTLYFDGVAAGLQSNAIAPTDVAEALRIGYVYLGNLDEIAFYDKALSTDRILAHYHAR